jgi:hypothetical protein
MPSKHKMNREGWKQVGELAVIYADEGEGFVFTVFRLAGPLIPHLNILMA